jgi:hypothetical protein
MTAIIGSLSAGVPKALNELACLGRTLKKRAADVLAYFDRPGTSNASTEAINGPSRTSAAPRSGSGTSPTTPPDHYSRPAASDPPTTPSIAMSRVASAMSFEGTHASLCVWQESPVTGAFGPRADQLRDDGDVDAHWGRSLPDAAMSRCAAQSARTYPTAGVWGVGSRRNESSSVFPQPWHWRAGAVTGVRHSSQ